MGSASCRRRVEARSRRPRGAHRQPPGDERPLRCPTATTSGSPPGDGKTADDVPSFLEHAAVSFSGALGRMFPTDADDEALASFKPPLPVRRSLARDVHRRLPAPRRHPTPTARSVALDVAAGTDHAWLRRDRFHQTCAPRDCPHDRLRGVPGHGTLNRNSRRFAQSDRSSRGSEDEQERTRLPRRRRNVRDQGQRRAHGGGRVFRHRPRPRAGRTRRHRGLKDAVVQGGRRPFETRSTDSMGGQQPGACRSSRQRLRRSCTPSPCIGVKALGLENRSFPCACVPADLRARASRIAWSADALHAEGDRTADGAYSLGRGTFGPGTIIDVRTATPSPSRAAVHESLEFPRNQTPLAPPRLRTMSPVYGILPPSAVPIAGRTMRRIPPWCALVRSVLITGAVGLLTAGCVTSPNESQRYLESPGRQEERKDACIHLARQTDCTGTELTPNNQLCTHLIRVFLFFSGPYLTNFYTATCC